MVDDYISGAIAIASNASLQYSLRVDILRYNKRLYNNHSIITEWEKMLEYVVSTPRPTPFAELIAGDESVGYELKFDTGDSSFSDATLVRTQSFIVNDARFAEELDLAVSLPYNGKEPIVISALKSRSPVDSVPVPMTTRCSNESFIKCADFLLSENSTKLSLAILLTRPQHVSGSVLEWFPSFVASLELSLGHSLPGGQIKEVGAWYLTATAATILHPFHVFCRYRWLWWTTAWRVSRRENAYSCRQSINTSSFISR